MENCNVSVIIPYYNKWPRTKYLMKSLSLQTFPKENYEVIIIDDGSEIPFADKAIQMPVEEYHRVIRTQNQGRSAARNEGAKHAKGEILIFLDDDMILSPNLIQQHYEVHKQHKRVFCHGLIYDLPELMFLKDPEGPEKVEFVQSRRRVADTQLLSFERVFEQWDTFIKNRRISRLEKLIQSILMEEHFRKYRWIGSVGGNLSISRDIFLEAGGFDGAFTLWGGEDFELGYRLMNLGCQGVNAEECFAYHMTHAHQTPTEQRNICKDWFYKKHSDSAVLILYEFLENKITLERVKELLRKEEAEDVCDFV